MRYLRGKLSNGRILIRVGIKPFRPYSPVEGVSSAYDLNYQEFSALVDTGALRTCISQNVVERLGLRRRGRTEIWNIRRPETHFTYLFDVGIWPDPDGNTPPTVFGLASGIEGIDIGNHPYFDVLLGMDILQRGSLHLEADGRYEIAFPG
jgi:hypothetical protein